MLSTLISRVYTFRVYGVEIRASIGQIAAKACNRCNGDLQCQATIDGHALVCLQCGKEF